MTNYERMRLANFFDDEQRIYNFSTITTIFFT